MTVICVDCGGECVADFSLCTKCQVRRSNEERHVTRSPVPAGYITTKEAAAIVNRHHETISGWCRNGRYDLSAKKIHGTWFVSREDIEALVGVIPANDAEVRRDNGRNSVAKIQEIRMHKWSQKPQNTAEYRRRLQEKNNRAVMAAKRREAMG